MAGHPHIAACAAIGVPDEKTGETVKLFVVLDNKADKSVTEVTLAEWARQYLTPYKVPKQYEFREVVTDDAGRQNFEKRPTLNNR